MNIRPSQSYGLAVILAAAIAVGSDVAPAETGLSARQIYDATGVTDGVVVHVGCGDAKLTGALGAVDPADGKSLAQYQLPAAPAWDGMAAAPGRLYVSTRDGQLLCMGSKAGKIAFDLRASVKKQ